MEEIKISHDDKPLEMERKEKLKIWGIVSRHKSLPFDLINQKLILSITVAYNIREAVANVQAVLPRDGFNTQEFDTPFLSMGKELDFIISQVQGVHTEKDFESIGIPIGEPVKLDEKEKTTMDMVAYVKFIFDTVGTDEEKKVAGGVIKKFEDYAKNLIGKK